MKRDLEADLSMIKRIKNGREGHRNIVLAETKRIMNMYKGTPLGNEAKKIYNHYITRSFKR